MRTNKRCNSQERCERNDKKNLRTKERYNFLTETKPYQKMEPLILNRAKFKKMVTQNTRSFLMKQMVITLDLIRKSTCELGQEDY